MKSVKRNDGKQSRRRESKPGKMGGETARGRDVRDVRESPATVRTAVRSPRRVRPIEEEGVRQDLEIRGTRPATTLATRPDMSITESDAGTMYRFTTLQGLVIETFVASQQYLRAIEKFRKVGV